LRRILGRRAGRLAVAVALLGLVGGAVAYASIPDGSGVIHACYKKSSPNQGVLRVIDTQLGQTCANNELSLYWNQRGPSGPSGASGPAGASGPSGPSGLSGDTGPSGPSGASGLSGPSGDSGPSGPSGDTGSSGPSGAAGTTYNFFGGTVDLAGISPAIGVNQDLALFYGSALGRSAFVAGTISNVIFNVSTPPGAGNYWGFQVISRGNGGLHDDFGCLITGSAQSCTIANPVSVDAGDFIEVEAVVAVGSPAATRAGFAGQFVPST